MKDSIIKLLRNILPTTLKNVIAEPYLEKERKKIEEQQKFVNLSYSQEGEDLFLKRFFADKKEGFFIDVGAHHPKRFSNTYIFYQKGWRGINIDAMPNSMKAFDEIRKEDINLEIGISSETNQELTYHILSEPALNTFSEEIVAGHLSMAKVVVKEKIKIPVQTLKQVLDIHLLQDQKIDFMSVDVEGLDLNVLQSNDWETYRPTILVVESLGMFDVEVCLQSELVLFLKSVRYKLIAKTVNDLFFQAE
jgi:FkbM family methyltransferase